MAMTDDQKLSFVHKMTKTALEHVQHFDSGGTVNAFGDTSLGGPSSSTGTTTGGAQNPNQGLIGSIGNALGQNNNFQAGSANIQQGTNQAQLNQSYSGAQGAIGQQQGLVNQFQPGTAQGLGAQSTLSGQLGQQALGLGPNPAQAALNQSTGQNIAQQAALMAGQRGAGANAGLLATQAAQQGANTQQQAIGQGATLQAQQQLAAQNAQANLAAQQVAQGAAGIQGLSNAQQNEQNILQGANTAANNAAVTQQSNINAVNSQTAQANQAGAGKLLGGLQSAVSSLGGGLASGLAGSFARGGVVGKDGKSLSTHHEMAAQIYHPQCFAGGGSVDIGAPVNAWLQTGNAGGQGELQSTGALPMYDSSQLQDIQFGAMPKMGGANPFKIGAQAGGAADAAGAAAPSALEEAAPLVLAAYKGGLMEKGGKVDPKGKSQKAQVEGDSLKNDKIPTMLSAGELVIDRDTMNDKGPMGQMARALKMHIESRNKGKAS